MTRVNLIESRGTSFDFSSKFRESNFPGERIYASKIFGKRSISSMGSVDKSVDNFIGYFLLFSSAGLKIVAGDRIPRNYYNFEQGVGHFYGHLSNMVVEFQQIYQPYMILMVSCWPMRNIIDIILSYLAHFPFNSLSLQIFKIRKITFLSPLNPPDI